MTSASSAAQKEKRGPNLAPKSASRNALARVCRRTSARSAAPVTLRLTKTALAIRSSPYRVLLTGLNATRLKAANSPTMTGPQSHIVGMHHQR